MGTKQRVDPLLVALLFGIPVLGTLIYLVLHPQSLDPGTLPIVRFLAAICAGVAGSSFTGSLSLIGNVQQKMQVQAAGGFAAFFLVLLIFFVGIPQKDSSNNVNVKGEALNRGDILKTGQQLISSNKCFRLTLQDDGNLVLYNDPGSPLWASKTFQQKSDYAVMQLDGNFVIYDNDKRAIWSSKTPGTGGTKLKVENDGNMAIYSSKNKGVWQTGTGEQTGKQSCG